METSEFWEGRIFEGSETSYCSSSWFFRNSWQIPEIISSKRKSILKFPEQSSWMWDKHKRNFICSWSWKNKWNIISETKIVIDGMIIINKQMLWSCYKVLEIFNQLLEIIYIFLDIVKSFLDNQLVLTLRMVLFNPFGYQEGYYQKIILKFLHSLLKVLVKEWSYEFNILPTAFRWLKSYNLTNTDVCR